MSRDDGDDRYEEQSDEELDAGQIRYDGPVRAPRRSRPRRQARRSLPFATAGVLAAAVVILLGVAWLLSGDEEPPPPPRPAAASAAEREEPAEPPIGERAGAESPGGAEEEREPPAPAPVSVASSGPTASSDPRPTPPPPEPAPKPAAAPAPTEPAAPSGGGTTLGALVRRGDVEGACREGNALAQSAARKGHYTVQVLSVSDPAGVRRAFDRVRDEKLVVVSVSSPRGPVYRLLWGFYPSVEAAREAAGSCPDYFPRSPSWPYTPTVATALTPIRR